MEDAKMKKTYINPTLEVLKIATQQMLCESQVSLSSDRQSLDLADGHSDDFDW